MIPVLQAAEMRGSIRDAGLADAAGRPPQKTWPPAGCRREKCRRTAWDKTACVCATGGDTALARARAGTKSAAPSKAAVRRVVTGMGMACAVAGIWIPPLPAPQAMMPPIRALYPCGYSVARVLKKPCYTDKQLHYESNLEQPCPC